MAAHRRQRPDEDDLVPFDARATTPLPEGSARDERGAPGPAPDLGERYRILALAGRGGMGNVYKAHDRVLDETVALKTMRPELLSDLRALERFRSEVKLARRVTHRNVARTFDTGVADGIPYLTMEFVEGEALDAWIRRSGRLDARRALSIALQVCEALDAAHAAGVVHRDLKPPNVLVEPGGRVVLTDFGIARASAGLSRSTGMMMIGSPAYMAPEQVRGAEVGPPADLFALGVMLFEMLTGKLPWEGPSPIAIAAARLTSRAPDPRSLRPELPEPIAALVLRLLETDPRDRPGSAREVARALASLDVPAEEIGASAESRAIPRITPSESFAFAALRERTVAVLPFRVRGEDASHLAEGLAEELTDELSRIRGVRVRPLGAVLARARQELDPRELGRALGVQVVVEGTVRIDGATLRGRVALISVAEGFQLWAERFEGDAMAIFEVSARAAAAIAEALLGERFGAQRQAPSSPEAAQAYLRARHALRMHWYEGSERASELFELARALAPDDPRVLSGAATAAARRAFRATSSRADLLAHAGELADRAIVAAPEHPEPFVAKAIVELSGGHLAAALAALRSALDRGPDHVDAHELAGQLRLEVGPLDVAIAHLRTALELDPGVFKARWELCRAYALRGDWDDADALLAIDVEDAGQRKVRDANRSRLDLWRRSVHAAPRWADELAASDSGSDDPMSRFVRVRRAVAGTGALAPVDRAYVERAIADATEGSRYQLVLRQFFAEMLATIGDHESALAEIEHAACAGLSDLLWLERCPSLLALAGDARFARAVDAVRQLVSAPLPVGRTGRG